MVRANTVRSTHSSRPPIPLLVGLIVALLLMSIPSTFYGLAFVDEKRWLITLERGELILQVVEEWSNYSTLEWVWDDGTFPTLGLRRLSPPGMYWRLPTLSETFASAAGEWWTLRIPFWFLIAASAGCFSWLVARRRSASCKLAQNNAESTAAALARNRRSERDVRKFRRSCRFGYTILTILVMVFILSGFLSSGVRLSGAWRAELSAGSLTIASSPEGYETLWPEWWIWPWTKLEWTLPHYSNRMQSTYGQWEEYVLPLWVPILLFAALAIRASLRIRRSRRTGACARCGYDLTGNVSGRCPECATPVPRELIESLRIKSEGSPESDQNADPRSSA